MRHAKIFGSILMFVAACACASLIWAEQPLTEEQVKQIRAMCYNRFNRSLDGCLKRGDATPRQCLENAASLWVKCMKSEGINLPRPTRGVAPATPTPTPR
jgi:hypothetical protein